MRRGRLRQVKTLKLHLELAHHADSWQRKVILIAGVDRGNETNPRQGHLWGNNWILFAIGLDPECHAGKKYRRLLLNADGSSAGKCSVWPRLG